MIKRSKRLIAAGMVGNIIEVYDMSIYGMLAPFIAHNFFPRDNNTAALLATFSVFLFGFLSRPIGAIFFGHIGDTLGRKKALVVSILLMAVATALVGILPNFYTAGVMGSVLLIIARLFQGLSVGGEYTGSVILLVESAPENKRGLYGGFAMMGSNIGTLLASFVCWIMTFLFTKHYMMQWGWRLPFIAALVGGVVGYYIRAKINETSSFNKTQKPHSVPFFDTLRYHRKELILTLCLTWLGVVATYLIFVYNVTYLTSILHYSMAQALFINTLSIVLLVTLIPLAGWFSDKIGRRAMIIASTCGLALLIYPYFYVLSFQTFSSALIIQFAITIPSACFFGVTPVAIVEMMPTRVRYSAASLGYNLGATIFGGTTPLIATLLLHMTGYYAAPAVYLIFASSITLIACAFIPGRAHPLATITPIQMLNPIAFLQKSLANRKS